MSLLLCANKLSTKEYKKLKNQKEMRLLMRGRRLPKRGGGEANSLLAICSSGRVNDLAIMQHLCRCWGGWETFKWQAENCTRIPHVARGVWVMRRGCSNSNNKSIKSQTKNTAILNRFPPSNISQRPPGPALSSKQRSSFLFFSFSFLAIFQSFPLQFLGKLRGLLQANYTIYTLMAPRRQLYRSSSPSPSRSAVVVVLVYLMTGERCACAIFTSNTKRC